MIKNNDKQKALNTIKRNEFNEISNKLVTVVYKNKKKYTRKLKHKTK